MTPFGIRKIIKKMLFGERIPHQKAPERPRHPVLFELSGNRSFTADAKEGDSLVLASGRGPFPIGTGCSDGTCATCRCEVLTGADMLSQEDDKERRTKAEHGCDDSFRLGCQAAVLGPGVSVRVINVLGEELVDQ